MEQGGLGRDPLGGVEGDQLAEQVQAMLVEVLELLLERLGPELGEGLFEVRQLRHPWPLVIGGSPVELEDLEDLADFRVSSEKGLLLDQFTENAADSPHIHP